MTRAEVEKTILARLKIVMKAAGLSDGADGTNPDLRDPIQTALLQMEFGSDFEPSDTNLIQVVAADQLEFLLRAEIRTLRNIMGNIQGTDISMSVGKNENRSQLITQVETMLRSLNEELALWLEEEEEEETEAATAASGILVGGTIALDFQDQYEDSW